MKLSIIIPVYNEQDTIRQVVEKVQGLDVDKEIIVVNDGSTDGTKAVLDGMSGPDLIVLHNEVNRGKGYALACAGSRITSEAVVVQDADCEYDPADLPSLFQPVAAGECRVVYGSRFLKPNRFISRRQWWANRLLTGLTNCLYRARLTDMETCYKLMRTDIWRRLSIRSKGFEIEPEITAKLLKQGIAIRELPVSFCGRGYRAGKKIGWRDGLKAIGILFKYRFYRQQ